MDDLSEEIEPNFDQINNKDAFTFEKTLNTNLPDDSYEEEEIFFGPISNKEEKLIEMWKNRKTEYYSPSRFRNFDTNSEEAERSESSLAQDSDVFKNLNSSDVQDFKCQLSDNDIANAEKHIVQVTDLELGECEDNDISNVEEQIVQETDLELGECEDKDVTNAEEQIVEVTDLELGKCEDNDVANVEEQIVQVIHLELDECEDNDVANAEEKLVQVTHLELGECENVPVESNARHDTSVEYYCDKLIENLDSHLKSTHACNISLNSNCGEEESLNNSKLSRSSNEKNQDLSEDKENYEMLTNEFDGREHDDSKCIISTDNNIKGNDENIGHLTYDLERSSKCNISTDENQEVIHLTHDLERSLVLKKSYSNSEPNDLNKPDNCILKRESYFTSLQIINVNDETFNNFTLDSLECNTSAKICNSVAIKNSENDVRNIKIPEEFSIDSLEHNSSLCESHTSFADTTENSLVAQSLPEDSSDTDCINNGILLSRSLSLKSSNNESSNCCIHHDEELSCDVNLQEERENHNQTNEQSIQDYPDSPPSFSPPSPDSRFNDTIEEMERLLAHGINYYKDLELQEESVHQAKEQTISSSSSVHSFNPNFDSTRTSDNLKKDADIKYDRNPSPLLMEKEVIEKDINSIKSVPVKPPRIIISNPTPKSEHKRVPIDSNYKRRKDDTPPHINSPIVKTVTKSKIGSYTPAANRKEMNRNTHSNTPKHINTTPYNTPGSRGITTIIGSSFPNKLVNTPASTKFTPKNLASKSSYYKAGLSKIPRISPDNKIFRTPQNTLPKVKIIASRSAQPTSRQRTLKIESPVANYLQNNPPPPLITTVKPRYKLSPLKSQTETAQDNFRKTPLKESNMISKSEMMTSRIPPSVHKQGEGILVNKENLSTKRMVPGDRPPVYVLKHKGRMKLPKDTILKNYKEDSKGLITKTKEEAKMNTERFDGRDSGRDSLMEISIYEKHLVRHGNTLK